MASLTTSYFAVAKRLKGIKISTARFNIPRLVGSLDEIQTSFAPSVRLLQEYKGTGMSWSEYTKHYREEQRRHFKEHPEDFGKILTRATIEDVILLCYEKFVGPKTQCHRMLLYDMLKRVAEEGKHRVNFVDEKTPYK